MGPLWGSWGPPLVPLWCASGSLLGALWNVVGSTVTILGYRAWVLQMSSYVFVLIFVCGITARARACAFRIRLRARCFSEICVLMSMAPVLVCDWEDVCSKVLMFPAGMCRGLILASDCKRSHCH